MIRQKLSTLSPLTQLELTLSFLFLMGLLIHRIPGSLMLQNSLILALGALYCWRLYRPSPPDTRSVYPIVISKWLRLSSSLLALGICFMFLNVRGHSEILLAGIFMCTLGCAAFLLFGLRKLERIRFFRLDIIRGLALIILSLALLFSEHLF